jgi:hypothetical protein
MFRVIFVQAIIMSISDDFFLQPWPFYSGSYHCFKQSFREHCRIPAFKFGPVYMIGLSMVVTHCRLFWIWYSDSNYLTFRGPCLQLFQDPAYIRKAVQRIYNAVFRETPGQHRNKFNESAEVFVMAEICYETELIGTCFESRPRPYEIQNIRPTLKQLTIALLQIRSLHQSWSCLIRRNIISETEKERLHDRRLINSDVAMEAMSRLRRKELPTFLGDVSCKEIMLKENRA